MHNKRTVAILGGGFIKDNNKWRTTGFDEPGDNFGALGDRLRVVAASYLYKENKCLLIILGGKGQLGKILDAPFVSEVIEQELIELGVKSDDILTEHESNNTFEQLKGLLKILKKKKLKEVTIISNRYHLPRLKAFLNVGQESSVYNIKLISAEEVLIKHDPGKWKGMIEKAYNRQRMAERMKLEKQGVKQIVDGTYQYGK